MATWFMTIAHVARIEPILYSALTSAICCFAEGDVGKEKICDRWFRVSFYGDKLIAGKAYIISGSARLQASENFQENPEFTCNSAIEYLGTDVLPVHRLRVTGAGELKEMPTINRSSDQESYEFQLKVAGYYSDPVPDESQKKAVKANSTRITEQTFFALAKQKLFQTFFGNTSCRVGNKYFFEGEYTFAYPPGESGSYIELTYISYNSTHKNMSVNHEPLPAGDGGRKFTSSKKGAQTSMAGPSSVPVTPQNNHFQFQPGLSTMANSPASASQFSVQQTPQPSQFGPPLHFPQSQPQFFPPKQPPPQYALMQPPATPIPATPYAGGPPQTPTTPMPATTPIPATPYAGASAQTTPATGQSGMAIPTPTAPPSYQMDDFVDLEDGLASQAEQATVSPSELSRKRRRGKEKATPGAEEAANRPKRTRKPTKKAAAHDFFDTHSLETEGGGLEFSENEDEEDNLF